MKYKIGEVYNNRKLIKGVNGHYIIVCLKCGKIAKLSARDWKTKKCPCSKPFSFTKKPLNKKLSQIREKYKDGVKLEHIEAMFK